MLRRLSVAIGTFGFLVIAPAIVVSGQDNWGSKMLDRQTVDFGSVAKGAECKQRLKVRNLYNETIQLTANSSCACFRAAIVGSQTNQVQIPSGQTVEVELTVNTVNYQKKRDATLTVSFYEPTRGSTAEVRVPLQAYIRTDVVFTPGAVDFGSVDVGAGAKQLVKVAYAGRPDWQIREVKSTNGQIVAQLKETGRANGLVNYEVLVELKPGTPAGTLRDELILITDDDNSPQVPVAVRGTVEADVTVVPPVLAFGTVTPGDMKKVKLVIRAKKPFQVEKIEREKADDSFRVKLPEDTRALHELYITLVTPSEPGAFDEVFTITISGRSEPISVRAKGLITAPAPANAN